MNISESPGDEVDNYIDREMQKRRIPGLAVVVVQHGKIVKQQAYGLANIELNVPISTATVFPLFSLTKTFTSISILSLVEDGKLSLDDSIKQWLPDSPDSWAPVTLRHCLSHTSGLPDAVDEEQNWIPHNHCTLLEVLASKPVQPPGEKVSYNQTGFVLLGRIIKIITNRDFEEFVRNRFLIPFEMKNTTFGDSREVVARRTSWYSSFEPSADRRWIAYRNHEPVNSLDRLYKFELYSHPRSMFTCIGLNSDIVDMTKWELAISSGRLLKSSTLDQITQPFRLKDGTNAAFGLGWLVDKSHNGHQLMGFNGGNATVHLRFIDDDLSVILLTNLQGARPDSIATEIASFYLPSLKTEKGLSV